MLPGSHAHRSPSGPPSAIARDRAPPTFGPDRASTMPTGYVGQALETPRPVFVPFQPAGSHERRRTQHDRPPQFPRERSGAVAPVARLPGGPRSTLVVRDRDRMQALERYAVVRFPAVGGLLIARAGDGWDDVVVKRSTAIIRRRERSRWSTRTTSWPDVCIVAGFAFGAADRAHGRPEAGGAGVPLVHTRPEEVPWLARPARLEVTAAQLRFDKLPLAWWWRSADGPGVEPSHPTCRSPGPRMTASTLPWSTRWPPAN